jgi:hypothetical protein
MAYDVWPPLIVRDWRSVLELREPNLDFEEDYYDGILTANASRRIHELRGIIVGQVAEIENLLLYMAKQVRERCTTGDLGNRRAGGPTGVVFAHVKELLQNLKIKDEFGSHLEMIQETIERRNAIVHAVVLVGISYSQFNDSREPMLILMRDNDDKKWEARFEAAAELDPWEADEIIPGDVSKIDLERQLTQAYEALDRCVDIWVRVDQILPGPPTAI